MNSRIQNIQFTYEEEVHNKISFYTKYKISNIIVPKINIQWRLYELWKSSTNQLQERFNSYSFISCI